MEYEMIIVGGGLSGCLLFLGIKELSPDCRVLLIEREDHLGGNHTWSFHGSDIPEGSRSWLAPYISKSWAQHEVKFPQYERTIRRTYNSIRSHELSSKILKDFSSSVLLNQSVSEIQSHQVILDKGDGQEPTALKAQVVVDATGWTSASPSNRREVGYQKFLGLDVELEDPHGLLGATLMDAQVDQIDGYRFVYLLPWTEHALLIEDTYYSEFPDLDLSVIEARIHDYIRKRGWKIRQIHRREVGCLPLRMQKPIHREKIPQIGAASELYQPVTGYTFPSTLRLVQDLLQSDYLDAEAFKQVVAHHIHMAKAQEGFFCLLNRMLFKAALPKKRYLVLQKFYRLPEELILRFYSGRLNNWDKVRILTGRPPVPLTKAIKCFVN